VNHGDKPEEEVSGCSLTLEKRAIGKKSIVIWELIPNFQGMIRRRMEPILLDRLNHSAAVALIGPRQVGKTTLARGISMGEPSLYLDLECPSDLAKMEDPELYLGRIKGAAGDLG
jgi:predicted AAA+ superfamily ATPase